MPDYAAMTLTRRRFAAAAASSLTLAGLPAAAQQPPAGSFPAGFRWGTATSAYQVEGAARQDGRGVSIWDTFCRVPGKIVDGSNADVSVDHYNRYKDDVALMKAMGASAYRFSIAWPRVFPEGRGAANPRGLDFYDRLVDELLAQGIEPFGTLYHWDLPQALQDKGGWVSRDTALAFGDYAGHVAARLSDRVRSFFTLNEIYIFTELGYGSGYMAPGLMLPDAQVYQARHHGMLAHGLAVQAIRAQGRAGTKVGPAENITVAVPAVETPQHIRAAEKATRELNSSFFSVILEGSYHESFLTRVGADAPKFTDADLKIISSPVDFVGINSYSPTHYVVASDDAQGYVKLPFPASHPRMGADWITVGPEAMYWGPRHVAKLWGVKEIYITENGTPAADVPAADGIVYDVDRVMYLRNYLTHLQRATAEGVPVRGYFVWSLLDNFEWVGGYGVRFGLIHVDYATQKRTPKLSAAFYKEVIARNALA